MVDLPTNIPLQEGAPPPPKAGRKGKPVTFQGVPSDGDDTQDVEQMDVETSLTKDEINEILIAAQAAKYKKAQPKGPGVQRMVMPSHKGMPTRRILLEDNPDIPPSGQFIGHNGVSYLVRTGVWVDVPLPLIEVLDHAVMQVPERNHAQQIIGWREKLRYPYRVAPGQVPYPAEAA